MQSFPLLKDERGDIMCYRQNGVRMSAVYNPEAETMADIEKLELEARLLRRRIELARNEEDRRVLRRQLNEVKEEYARLQERMP